MNFSDLKILIVDDLGSARKILKKLLTEVGIHCVDEASNGEEAYQKTLGSNYSLIISDWEMPKLKGIELLKKLRADARFEKLPFIIVTSLNQRENVVAAVEAGTSDYIAKPFTSETLKVKIEQLLGCSEKSDQSVE